MKEKLTKLAETLEGKLHLDKSFKLLYATDASAYRELPLAVAIPKTIADIHKLIEFAGREKCGIIPRAAGTSLAGQVVGNGIVVDISKHFRNIININPEEKWVAVQPGVIRDELNMFLKPYGLFFGPETSTANRAMIGGMVGNNSCGSNSLVYGSTRDHVISVKAILSDGTEVVFESLDVESFHQKCSLQTLEGNIYRNIRGILGNYDNRQEIINQFPKPSINRRNTGYAIDVLLNSSPFIAGEEDFNFCKLICGSEGTLAFITEIKLKVSEISKLTSGLLCVHFNSIDEALRANLIGLKYRPSASELIDHYILACTKDNIEQRRNRFFVQGDPAAILVIELNGEDREAVVKKAQMVETEMREHNLGYHFPLLFDEDTTKIWSLRKAGLGLLGNIKGDDKPVPVIEDTAVDVNDLPEYIREFNEILAKYNLYSVHYAHAGSGELHLRPIIDLKTKEGNALFRIIAQEIAVLVKKYNGSLSGEHGDGRLRGEFIKQMIGKKNYELLRSIKNTWDPHNIFNPEKIIDTPSMNTMLRYDPAKKDPVINTYFRYDGQTVLQHTEQCNGTAECRKSHLSGGTMCPSYMATLNEKDSTRARANILREFLTHSNKVNPFDHQEIKEVLDLCLSCKACKSECPSNVDMAKLKAEFLQHYYDANGIPFRSKLIASFNRSSLFASYSPGIYNYLVSTTPFSNWIKKISGFALERSMPKLHKTTLRKWYKTHRKKVHNNPKKTVYLFCDEFTNFSDTPIGIKSVLLLEELGYHVIIPEHTESARAWISKGLIKEAKKIIRKNIESLSKIVSDKNPLVGIEPSAILTLRDEYPDLADDDQWETAKNLAKNVFLIDEFLANEIENENIKASQFTNQPLEILLHGHCQQKALSSLSFTEKILSLPANYTVKTIPSGCCGMAGSFGYEKEHYELSMKIGELVLFPAIRSSKNDQIIVAPGTSCRHQIKDGTGKIAQHPVEILYDALAK